MIRTNIKLFCGMAFSLLLAATVAAQDAGQFVILHAEYGNEQNHVNVTHRLKELARADRPFRVTSESMATDPAHGQAKVLRVFARGPNGQERNFDFPDNSAFDGAQFRSFGRGEWGDDRWAGGWNGSGGGGGYSGQFLILSAQYGSRRKHVDVTNQLKQMARADMQVRLNYRTFGVDPDEGHAKVLRIFARGPGGHERMFEYRDNSIIDGTQFRGWGRGEWGGPNDRWSGRWDPR
jgi:hypothetical protein